MAEPVFSSYSPAISWSEQRLGDGDRAVEIIRVGGAETGDLAAGLRPSGCILGMGVDYAADFGEGFVENEVSWKI